MRLLNLVKVVAAFGMIVLVLEDEIASNKATQLRDRRARQEMEKYTEIFLEAMPIEEKNTQYDQICEVIAGASRFSKSAIVVRSPDGRFRLAGAPAWTAPWWERSMPWPAVPVTTESAKSPTSSSPASSATRPARSQSPHGAW